MCFGNALNCDLKADSSGRDWTCCHVRLLHILSVHNQLMFVDLHYVLRTSPVAKHRHVWEVICPCRVATVSVVRSISCKLLTCICCDIDMGLHALCGSQTPLPGLFSMDHTTAGLCPPASDLISVPLFLNLYHIGFVSKAFFCTLPKVVCKRRLVWKGFLI